MLLVEWAQESNLMELTSLLYNENCNQNFDKKKEKNLKTKV
jgi:hypothetical protein